MKSLLNKSSSLLDNSSSSPSSNTIPRLRVLHLAGSSVSQFYYNLSMIYAKEVVQPVGVSSHYAVVDPDGFWQLGRHPDNETPFIVKPNSEDNSLGVTLVRNQDEIAEALRVGFEFDETLLVEDFIPGRELRVAVIEGEGKLWVPPMIEYLLSKEHPIRTVRDKYDLQSDGTPSKQPDKPTAKPICPANVTPELFEKIADAAKRAHIALGCRDYSLYDFRIHAETNEPYMLEAGLFWCFGKISMISRMLLADGQSLEDVALELWSTAAKRTRVACGSLFKYVNLEEK